MVDNQNQEQLEFSIFNTKMAVESMRSSGYISPPHALAELIDNSIEAGATEVEIIVISRRDETTGHFAMSEIAVLDNGSGMDPITLRSSLRYGDGTRQHKKGIGYFGLGLPNSSMSQARCVDVWTWETSITNSFHTRLSIEDVEKGAKVIPEPTNKPIPEVYKEVGQMPFGNSGTLVVWSDLDRIRMKRATTLFSHSQNLLGRIYRRFLAKPSERLHSSDSRHNEIGSRRSIKCIPVEINDGQITLVRNEILVIKPNDPLYLMSETSCPENFGTGPMFRELYQEPLPIDIALDDEIHHVWVRASYARPHVRNSDHPEAEWPEEWATRDAGHTPWGKHAGENTGISIVRAHREIELDRSWTNGEAPERWWKIEIDFPPALDNIFGVANNKQGATTLKNLAYFDWESEALPNEVSAGDVRRRLEEEGDPRSKLLELRKAVEDAIHLMREKNKEIRQRRDRHTSGQESRADAQATAVIERRKRSGFRGESDEILAKITPNQQKEKQAEMLHNKYNIDQDQAKLHASKTLEFGNVVSWAISSQESPSFFDIDSSSVLQVIFNSNHPVHTHLYEPLFADVDNMTTAELKAHLSRLVSAFRLLVYSWARYEEEQPREGGRRAVRNSRIEWGKYAEEFLLNNPENALKDGESDE